MDRAYFTNRLLVLNTMQYMVDFKSYGEDRPLKAKQTEMCKVQMSLDKLFFAPGTMRLNELSLVDDLFVPFGLEERDAGTFWDIGDFTPTTFDNKQDINGQGNLIIGVYEFTIDKSKRKH